MSRAAIIDGNVVVNVIEYDPDKTYSPRAGLTLVVLADGVVCGAGYIVNGSSYNPPPPYVPMLTEANKADLIAKATAAFAANATFQALAAPTNAQTLAQVKLLTREWNALAKLFLSKLEDTLGT